MFNRCFSFHPPAVFVELKMFTTPEPVEPGGAWKVGLESIQKGGRVGTQKEKLVVWFTERGVSLRLHSSAMHATLGCYRTATVIMPCLCAH